MIALCCYFLDWSTEKFSNKFSILVLIKATVLDKNF